MCLQLRVHLEEGKCAYGIKCDVVCCNRKIIHAGVVCVHVCVRLVNVNLLYFPVTEAF